MIKTANFSAKENLDLVNAAINQKLSTDTKAGLTIKDIDWAAEDDELKEDLKMFENMGVKMTYKKHGPTGWPVAKFVAKTPEAKVELSRWMIENYFSADLDFYKTIYPDCFKYVKVSEVDSNGKFTMTYDKVTKTSVDESEYVDYEEV